MYLFQEISGAKITLWKIIEEEWNTLKTTIIIVDKGTMDETKEENYRNNKKSKQRWKMLTAEPMSKSN